MTGSQRLMKDLSIVGDSTDPTLSQKAKRLFLSSVRKLSIRSKLAIIFHDINH